MLTACASYLKYYSNQENYINATGIVSHIKYGEDNKSLYLGFSELSPVLDDTNFKIVGKNLLIVQEKGIDQKISLGDKVEFITAPKYFGDGYIMPIVALSVNGEVLLEFEEGYNNLIEWLKR
jgi:hypothetical protein